MKKRIKSSKKTENLLKLFQQSTTAKIKNRKILGEGSSNLERRVLRKRCMYGKNVEKTEGPFVVTNINKKNLNLQVREEKKMYWNPVRNTRLFGKGQNVVSQE